MKICIRIIAIAVFGSASLLAQGADFDAASVRAEVDAAQTAYNKTYAANDVEAYFDFYTDDAILVTSGGREQPVAEYYEGWKSLIGAGGGVKSMDVNYERSIRPMNATTAVVHFISNTVSYQFLGGANGAELTDSTISWAETFVWQKIDGAWKVVHLHYHEIPAAE